MGGGPWAVIGRGVAQAGDDVCRRYWEAGRKDRVLDVMCVRAARRGSRRDMFCGIFGNGGKWWFGFWRFRGFMGVPRPVVMIMVSSLLTRPGSWQLQRKSEQ